MDNIGCTFPKVVPLVMPHILGYQLMQIAPMTFNHGNESIFSILISLIAQNVYSNDDVEPNALYQVNG